MEQRNGAHVYGWVRNADSESDKMAWISGSGLFNEIVL